jgi:CDGSH-type Zn-finger protein
MTKAEVAKKGPYQVELKQGTHWWCACGRSANQPLCDGAHSGTDISPVQIKQDEDKMVWLCGCKQTATPPFCDGSHNDLT